MNGHIRLLVITLMLFTQVNGHAQKKDKKIKIYKVWIELNDGSKENGFLYEVESNLLKVINVKSLNKNGKITIFEAKDISKIAIKRNGKGWRSTLIGAVGTAVVIEVMLLADDPGSEGSYISNEVAAVGFGVFFGAPIGAIIGTGRKKFNIDGNEAIFKSFNLEEYAIIKNK